MQKCLIADDHAVVRSGLARLLASDFPGVEFGHAEDSNTVLQLVVRDHWDLLILDLSLPGRGGLEVLEQVHESHPRLPVIVFSMHPEALYGPRVLRAGASGFLSKEAPPDQIIAAVRTVLAGHKFVSSALSEQLATRLGSPEQTRPHEALSDRELQVLRLIADGHPVGDIASQLSLSAKTVSTYRTRILEKLGLKSTADLVRYALEHRLVESRPSPPSRKAGRL